MSKRFLSFTAFSLTGMLLVTFLLIGVFQQVSRSSLERRFHDHNILLARLLRNGLADVHLLELLTGGDAAPRDEVPMEAFQAALRTYLRDLPVAKVKIFDRNGLTVYSSAREELGGAEPGNPGVVAALNGRSAGGMVYRERFNSFDGVIEDRDLHQQYIPIRSPATAQVEGVFEIYTDVTPLIEDIDRTQQRFVVALIVVLGAFFLGQIWLYHSTDRALAREKAQTDGYLRELEQIREELEARVETRTRELESSRYFLQSVIDGIANPLFVIRPDLRVSLMNRAARELIPAAAPAGRFTHCYQISHRRETPCNGGDHPCSFAEVMRERTTVTVQHTHFDAGDNPLIMDVTSTPLYGRDGELQGIVEVQHDVTELVRARQELAQSEARLQNVMDQVPDAILTLDPDGRIESVNQAATRLFDAPPGELLGREFHALFYAGRNSAVLKVEEGVREAGALRGAEERFPVDLWVGTVQLGTDRRYVAVVRDITERKRAERELERTRNQYYHQEKMAAIGQLAAGILHEVGNPIAAIVGAAQDMRIAEEFRGGQGPGCGLDEAVARNLPLIEEHAARLAKITREIADFASPRHRERELTDINGLIRSTARLLGYDRRFRGIGLRQLLDSRLPAVEAVPDQITQVLMNLMINAMDAAAARTRSEPAVEVLSRLAEGGVEIEVRDNGTGMDRETLEHAFEPFFTTKGPGLGTGLGLSLCESIVTSHGGSLRIESRPDAGTSVLVFLPESRAGATAKTAVSS